MSEDELLPLVEAWRKAIETVLDGGPASPLSTKSLTTFEEMANRVEAFYREVLHN